MTAELARAGGPVAAAGLAVLMLAPVRSWRLAGLLVWAAGCGGIAIWLAPSGHHVVYAAAALLGAAAAALLAWAFLRVPWLLPVAVLACAPARIPVSVGSTQANLLLPMYLVVAAAALALAWELLHRPARSRELGLAAWPVALFVAWSGLALTWSSDRHSGAISLLFYLLPFGLLAVSLSRLPWRAGWALGLYVQLAAMALVIGLIGIWQYRTRNIYWNPKVKVDNAYAPSGWYYRVNSVFYDPSIYGRFLVLGILASIVAMLFGRGRVAWAAFAVAAVTWVGLVPSFSQSSFVALAAGIVVVLAVRWRRRSVIPLMLALAALVIVSFGVPQARNRIFGKAGLSHATSGRSNLVTGGARLALRHPVLGVGTGAFAHAYAEQEHLRGAHPKKAASHTTPVTVAAETGLPGLALFVWLLGAVFVVPFRRNPVTTTTGRVRVGFGLALVAITVHSLFYNALFEDPLFWGALALSASAVREPEPA